jgi:hypothetical protein
MSANGISTLSNKQAKQLAKLELAQKKRQGYTLYANGNLASGTANTSAVFYRANNHYVITELPTEYSGSGNGLIDNPNSTGLLLGRPWTSAPAISPLLYLDAGNPASYSGGSTWTDTVNNIAFTLYGSPTYSTNNGGYLSFAPASSQYAQSTTGTGLLTTWTMEAWHYYTGTNSGGTPCILTERFTSGQINYVLGSIDGNLQTGFFNGGFHLTPVYTLTANNWYHIVGTYDGQDINLYINGVLVETTHVTGQTLAASNGGINLMRRWDNPDLWGGRLAVVRIYNTAASQTFITNTFNSEKSRYGL